MKAINAYITGWKDLFRNKRMWLLLYLFNFIFALFATFPLSGFLNQTVGDTLAANKSLPGFDYTFISDMLNQYGEGISLILNQSLVMVFAFLILSIFLMGGILNVLKNREDAFKISTFWNGCTLYFWRIFRLTFYFVAIHVALLWVFSTILIGVAGGISPFDLESDVVFINAFRMVFPVYLIFAVLFFMIQDYAKIHIVHEEKYFFTQTFWQTFRIVFRNFFSFFFLYLLNIGTFFLIFGIYWLVTSNLVGDSFSGITLLFVFGQAFVIARIGLRLLNLASANMIYKDWSVSSKEVDFDEEASFA